MAGTGILKTSIARKVAMALSALFLIVFLLQHLTINFSSIISERVFNEWSHFMGTNPIVQFVFQPILIFGVLFHFIMGFILEFQNRKARNINYTKSKGSANSSWMSRNMIWSGLVILGFLGLHFYDFWVPEINHKYVQVLPEDPNRYFEELQHKFENPVRVGIYVLSFVFLAFHLMHGFQSAFQSIGFNNRFTLLIKKTGNAYAYLVPLGFIVIALYHFFNYSN